MGQFNVGGGLLAAAGALGGLGQGLTAVGQEQQKENLAVKMNDLARAREEAITRLQQSGQQQLETQREAHEDTAQEKAQGFQREETNTKLTAASKAAGATRDFEAGQNEENRKTQIKRAEIGKSARIGAAEVSAHAKESTAGGKGGGVWQIHDITKTVNNENGIPMSTDKVPLLFNKKNGAAYVQEGDKYIRYSNTRKGPQYDPKDLARAPAADLQALLNDPLGEVPAGFKNGGQTKAEAFEAVHGYIPAQWTARAVAAEQAQRGGSRSTSMSLPSALVESIGGKGASSVKSGEFGGNVDAGPADNQSANDDSELDNEAPFQSGAMNTYGNMAQ